MRLSAWLCVSATTLVGTFVTTATALTGEVTLPTADLERAYGVTSECRGLDGFTTIEHSGVGFLNQYVSYHVVVDHRKDSNNLDLKWNWSIDTEMSMNFDRLTLTEIKMATTTPALTGLHCLAQPNSCLGKLQEAHEVLERARLYANREQYDFSSRAYWLNCAQEKLTAFIIKVQQRRLVTAQ